MLHVVLSLFTLAGYCLLAVLLLAGAALGLCPGLDHPHNDAPEEPASGDETETPDLILAGRAALSSS